MVLKAAAKWIARLVARVLVFPAACLALFGRFHEGFIFCAQALAAVPGMPGSYLRVAYYAFTLDEFGEGNYMALGSYFSHADACVGNRVGIGPYCILGTVTLKDHAMIGPYAQILSGGRQHIRDEQGRLTDDGAVFERVSIGTECWIGAAAVIMANLGSHVTVAAGSVVARDFPDGSIVAGNPARLVRPGASHDAASA